MNAHKVSHISLNDSRSTRNLKFRFFHSKGLRKARGKAAKSKYVCMKLFFFFRSTPPSFCKKNIERDENSTEVVGRGWGQSAKLAPKQSFKVPHVLPTNSAREFPKVETFPPER